MSRDSRGFNTISQSNLPRREAKGRRQRVAILAAFVVVALMVVIGLVILIASIARGDAFGKDPDAETGASGVKDIVYSSVPVTSADSATGDLVLVNSTHDYVFPETRSDLVKMYDFYASVHQSDRVYHLGGGYMNLTAISAMDKLLTEYYRSTGNANIMINSAYRSFEDQVALNSSVKAGQSDHHTGLGCSLSIRQTSDTNTNLANNASAYSWILQNAHKYGFIVRYPEAKADITGVSGYTYYFRYVGVAHATYMYESGICMEEYIELLKNYKFDGDHLKVTGADGNSYEIYYASVGADGAEVKCPANYSYEISGTNDGGVVVTVKTSKDLSVESGK